MTSSLENQPEEIYNVPGLKALSYRIARHDDSLQRMLASLQTQTTPPDQKDGSRPLAALTTSQRDDPAIALLDGWATVMEVLTFYQERIANEGFVNTVTERLSVLELSRTVGYELDPGVAASTHLAFTIEESDDVPEIVTVPEGTRVESVPIADEDSQVFETIETLEMRGAWNLLQPYFPSVTEPQKIGEDTVELKLSGTDTQLTEGDALLVVEEQVEPYESRYLTLEAVEPNDEQDYTLVSWSGGLGWEPRSPIQAFALREQATLFGSEAPDWNELSPEEKRLYGHDTGGVFSYIDNNQEQWKSISTGLLKNANVRALVREPNSGSLFVGTDNGIFCSQDEGQNWREINKGLTNLDIYSLAVNEKGYIFAGATEGNVFRSIDLGESWVEIGSGGVSVVEHTITNPGEDDQVEEWTPIETSLPSSIIRCLAVYSNIIYAGTEYGIFRSQNSGRTWEDINKVSGESSGLSGTIVYAITVIKEEDPNSIIFVGTDRGVFRFSNNGDEWEKINNGQPPVGIELLSVYSLVAVNIDGKDYLFAGTNAGAGVFICEIASDISVTWVEINNGEMTSETAVSSLSIASIADQYYIYAGTNQGVFQSQIITDPSVAVDWRKINTGLINLDIRSILGYPDENNQVKLLAGSWFDSLYTKEWPGFAIAAPQIDLNGTYTNILAGSWLVLTRDDRSQAYKVERVATVLRNDFGQNGKITRIYLETGEGLRDFGEEKYRETLVKFQSEALELFAEIIQLEPPVEGDQIELDRVVPGLAEERKIIISGKQMRVRIPPMGSVVRQSLLNDKTWATLKELWTYTDVNDLLINRDDPREKLFAGTARGVLTLELGSDSWDTTKSPNDATVSALESYEDNGTIYILAGTADGIIFSKKDGDSWERFNDDLSNVRALEMYTEKGDRYLLAGTADGIFRRNLDKAETEWEDITEDLPDDEDVTALATYAESGIRTIFVGTTAGNVFSFKSDHQSWIKFDNSVPNENQQDIQALATYELGGSRYLLAGIIEGVFRLKLGENAWEDFNTNLESKNVLALNIYEDSGDISLLAGTNNGIFGRDLKDLAASWQLFDDSWDDNKEVRALKTYDYNDRRYILTAIATKSILSRDLGSNSWQKLADEGLTNTNVRSLKIYRDGNDYLLAGTAGGIFRQDLSGNTWNRFDNGLTNTDVRALEIYKPQDGDDIIFAGTAEDVCRRKLNEDTWQKLARGWINREVRALKIYEDNDKHYILAGTSEGVFCLDLGKNSDELWISLNNDSSEHRLLDKDVRALDIYQQDSKQYILAGTKSGVFSGLLENDPDDKSKDTAVWTQLNESLTNTDVYSLAVYSENENSETTLFAGTRGGNIYRRELFRQDNTWKQIRFGLANDVRAIAISKAGQVFIGTRNRSILKGTESVEVTEMEPEDSLSIWQRRELTADNKLNAMSSQSEVASLRLVRWELTDKLGFRGEITTALEEILLESAAEEDKILSEVASLGKIEHGQLRTTLTCTKALTDTYDRATVTINANVAVATHGETVSEEVVGSGDGSQINQEFVLKNLPLTYIPADTASGSQSTLTVRVDGLLWEEVPSLYQLTSPAQSYMTRIDDDGQTKIIFGDGYKGARPTTGEENITATYRSGIGPDGQVAANTITLVQAAPLGVVEVTNPQGATGAAPPETRDEARQNAPLNTLSLDRIISLRDYEYFIGSFSGIGKAKATALTIKESYSMVQVTIAGRNGDSVAADSNLYTQILEAVEAARDPTLRVGGGSASEFSLNSYQRLLFNIEAKLWIDPQYLASAVIPEVEKALQEAFAFEVRAFAQNVTAAEIVTLIQSINGVDGADLDALYLEGRDRQLNQILEARSALGDGLEVQPAQLLLLNPAAGSITLEEVLE